MSQAYMGGRAVWVLIKNQPANVQRTYSNPYALGTVEWADWERGFMSAN